MSVLLRAEPEDGPMTASNETLPFGAWLPFEFYNKLVQDSCVIKNLMKVHASQKFLINEDG